MVLGSVLLSGDEWQAVWLSVRVALAAVVVGVGPAMGVALLLARREFCVIADLNDLLEDAPKIITNWRRVIS